MNAETSTADIAIDDFVAEICTQDAARGFIQTIISKFQETYAIEDPEKVKASIKPVVRALQGLHRKGFDMKPYADQLVAVAAMEFEKYSGDKDVLAYQSTLTVTDQVMHKRSTGFWKKEREF